MYTWLTAPHRAFSGPMKQSSQVKNPNGEKADQLTMYKGSRAVEPGTT